MILGGYLSAPAPELSIAISERYRIERELGRGGMATVYLADDLKHGRRVAIKFMNQAIGAAIGPGRFLREIEIAARLTHPHILPLFDSGAVGDVLFYVMPYIAGESLRARLDRETRLSLEEAVRLTREIACALAHAHQQGLVHRDLKPENILLSEGIVLVADFGIARSQADSDGTQTTDRADLGTTPRGPDVAGLGASETVLVDPDATMSGSAGLTRAGTILGTPLYMAPEQAAGDPMLDGRADQYALGCMLHELLTGQPPFEARTMLELLQLHARAEAPTVSSLRPEIPEAFDRIVSQAMSKSAAHRYPDMVAFGDALGAALSVAQGATPSEPPMIRVPNNLPKDRTRFVGRTRELSECVRHLSDARLLTITGIGGGGKTRLSQELARRVSERFSDGTWFVELASLPDGDRVPNAVASALSIAESPSTPITDLVEARLRGETTLLILNNCEHLRGDVAPLVDRLLAAAPNLRIIATSRAPIGASGERIYSLGSLSLPAPNCRDRASVAASESARLFVARAQTGDPNFDLDDETAAPVAEICRRLDGIPLALELAAARMRLLSVQDLLARLDDRFRLLVGGTKGALARHQTLRATIEWSYDQLEPDEQAVLRALGVFRGGWNLAAAAAVTGPDADEFDVLDRLGRLIDNSLIAADRGEAAGSRYVMLETVREYAEERLAAAGEFDAVAAQHLSYVHTVAVAAHAKFNSAEVGETTRAFDRDLENVVVALARCDTLPDGVTKSLEIVAALRLYWLGSGHLELGRRLAAEALARPGAQGIFWPRALGQQTMASIAYYQGRRDEARQAMEESLAISRALGRELGVAAGLSMLGTLAHLGGDFATARAYLTEATEIYRSRGDFVRVGSMLTSLASLHQDEGDLKTCIELHQEALRLSKEFGRWNGAAVAALNLALVSFDAGTPEPVPDHLRDGCELIVRSESIRLMMPALDLIGTLAAARGEWETAALCFGAAAAGRTANSADQELDCKTHVQALEQTRTTLGEARYTVAFDAGRTLELSDAFSRARSWLDGSGTARSDPSVTI